MEGETVEVDEASKLAVDPEALDALHILPLALVPMRTPALQKAIMIKNARLESVIEIFRDGSAGSGQVSPKDLVDFYQDSEDLRADVKVLDSLASLQSFDIYTLRAQLRDLDIGFSDLSALTLSPKKQAELNAFMQSFTRPLIARIYGSENEEVTDVSQIIQLLAQPDRQAAIKQLQRLADELNVSIMEVPAFLEHYGDIFLSLSYFRDCFDEVMMMIPDFIAWMHDVKDNQQVTGDPLQGRMLVEIESHLNAISKSVMARFAFFDSRTRDFWDNLNAESFKLFQDSVTAHHVSIGAVLCGLTVKMSLWSERFPGQSGSPVKRLEFLRSEIHPGLAHIRRIEASVSISD